MRIVLACAVLLASATARADEGVPGEVSDAEKLTMSARNAARDGRCSVIPALGERVRQLDADYHARVFAVDPELIDCRGDARRTLPVAAVAPPVQPTTIVRPLDKNDPAYRSPAIGLALSAGISLFGGLIIAADPYFETYASTVGSLLISVGPTSGHIYAGAAWQPGLAIRAGGGTVLGVGVGLRLFRIGSPDPEEARTRGNAVVIGGAAIMAIGSIYEIVTAPFAVRRWNQRNGHVTNLTLAPTLPTADGVGVALAGRF